MRVLYPAHKLEYFNKEGWPAQWKCEALCLVEQEWELYRPTVAAREDGANGENITGPSSVSSGQCRSGPGRRSAQASMRMMVSCSLHFPAIVCPLTWSKQETMRTLLTSMRKGPGASNNTSCNALKEYLESTPLVMLKDLLTY